MCKIKIKNFGPIKEGYLENDGWVDINKVTLFIGNQGSGKSTVAKLVSTFLWIEKALNRGDFKMERPIDLLTRIYWHNLNDYFQETTEIEYQGEKYYIGYWAAKNEKISVRPTSTTFQDGVNYIVPKIIYIPAERNFLSTIKEAFDLSGLPGPLADFSTELRKAQNNLNGPSVQLPVNDAVYEFNKQEGKSFIAGDGYRLNLLTASSGYQSLVPMYLVSRYLSLKVENEKTAQMAEISPNNRIRRDEEISQIWQAKNTPDDIQRINMVYAKYHNRCLVNIVEEPEQNLFPVSQKKMLYSLLEFNNMTPGNTLIVTTHSPYLINYLSIAIQADELKGKIIASGNLGLMERIRKIVPEQSTVSGADVAIYELRNGSIIRLPDYEGIPSDKNYLNQSLAEGNHLFDALLEIEQEL